LRNIKEMLMKFRFSSGAVILAILVMAGMATAQDLEPRSFSQAPVGMNFVSMTYGYSIGEVLFDQASPITEANGRVSNVVGAYVRTLGFFGASAKVAAVVPYAWGHWHGLLNGDYASTNRSGFADPRLQLSVNFVGAPAIKMSEMKTYTNNTVVGASIRVVLPLGQYKPEKLINLGQNRWGFRPRVGVSHKAGRWTLEGMGSVWLYTKNPDFYGGSTVTQDPLWSVQANIIHSFPSGIWFGVGAGFSRGGKTASDGVYGNTYKKNTRWAALFSYPLARRHSVKVIYIDGLSTRLGSNFDQVSISYLMRWGGEK